MNMTEYLGIGWVSFGLFLYALAMYWAFKTAPWYKVKGDRTAQNVLFGVSLVIVFIWALSASIGEGFSFHFLFMTVATLMFGPQFALMAMTLALLTITIKGDVAWTAFGVNAMLMGWLPIMITWWIYKIAYRFLDKNFFVYVFLNGFLAGSIGILVVFGLASIVLLTSGVATFEDLQYSLFPFLPLVIVPEGFLNGFVIAVLVVMKPEWVSTFHDDLYLKDK